MNFGNMNELKVKNKIPVSVIIVSFNTKELTRKALAALYNSEKLSEQIIVVDNNSNDDSVQMIKTEFPGVILIENKENLGFAKANNLAIREKVNQPFTWLLNSDTEVGAQTLGELFKYMEAHPRIGALGPQLVYPDEKGQSVGGFFPSPANVLRLLLSLSFVLPKFYCRKLKDTALYPQPLPTDGLNLDYVTGAAMFLRKAALDQAGLLGEDYFMYFEETDLCWRLKKAGWEVKATATDPVKHVYGGSFRAKYDPKRLKIFLASLKIFVKKNYRGFNKCAILLELFLFGRLSLTIKSLKS